MKKMFHNFARFLHNTRGVAAIEFAMIVPVLSFILVAMTDYGMFIYQKMELQDLSRQAVEYVIQGGQEGDVAANVINKSQLFTSTPPITYATATECECAGGADISCTTGTCTGNDYIRSFFSATITGTYKPILPWPGIASSITMTGYSRLQYAR